MPLPISFTSSTFHFSDWPDHPPLPYQKEPPDCPYLCFQEQAPGTKEFCIKVSDLANAGFSASALMQAAAKSDQAVSAFIALTRKIYRELTEAGKKISNLQGAKYPWIVDPSQIANATSLIARALISAKPARFQAKKTGLAAGIYVDSGGQVFCNLKKTSPLGKGSFARVKAAVWVAENKIVAKKVLPIQTEEALDNLKKEIALLKEFQGKRGIIRLISADRYEGRWVVYLDRYAHELGGSKTPLSPEQQYSAASQWLDGLRTIAEKGTHGDIKPPNLLLRQTENGIQAAIADFGSFVPLRENDKHGLSTITYAPPEYHQKKPMAPANDVWAMGLSLYYLFTSKEPKPLRDKNLYTDEAMKRWTAQLKAEWILEEPMIDTLPKKVCDLLVRMTDPNPQTRISASQAFEQFAKIEQTNL